MNAAALQSIAALCTQLHGAEYHPWVRENAPELIVAFAMVESSGREHVRGDGGKSWGLFQFGLQRWIECGGIKHEWDSADAQRQVEVMLRALSRYCHRAEYNRSSDYLGFCCACHNGHGTAAQRSAYYAKICKAWPVRMVPRTPIALLDGGTK